MTEKILFVDDDENALTTFKRNLRKKFHIETALGGEQGLDVIDSEGPFAVIVSDLRMPEMDGRQFLAVAKHRAPDSVLMMLTGYVDAQTAFEAVNEGTVFRFLIKPCPFETIVNALEAGIAQYRLVTADRELLAKTLEGTIEALTAILDTVNPSALSSAKRIKSYVTDIATHLQLSNLWELETAAILSQIGCITLPPDLMARVYAGESLTEEERRMFSAHPSAGSKLVANVPQLETIAQMIEGQQRPFNSYAVLPSSAKEREIALGAQILKVTVDLDQLATQGLSPRGVLVKLSGQADEYNPKVVAALAQGGGFMAAFASQSAPKVSREMQP